MKRRAAGGDSSRTPPPALPLEDREVPPPSPEYGNGRSVAGEKTPPPVLRAESWARMAEAVSRASDAWCASSDRSPSICGGREKSRHHGNYTSGLVWIQQPPSPLPSVRGWKSHSSLLPAQPPPQSVALPSRKNNSPINIPCEAHGSAMHTHLVLEAAEQCVCILEHSELLPA